MQVKSGQWSQEMLLLVSEFFGMRASFLLYFVVHQCQEQHMHAGLIFQDRKQGTEVQVHDYHIIDLLYAVEPL